MIAAAGSCDDELQEGGRVDTTMTTTTTAAAATTMTMTMSSSRKGEWT